ncbi:MAG: hypothetical protein E6K51_04415 [Gammaproteobacteria bacterium]|nr:MAG: hypothetical protein E6K51_04415 [Gammaproteobacteria bacterium]
MSIAMMSLGLLLGAMTLGTALAQTPPASAQDPRPAPRERAIPPPDELEPAVDTTRGAGAPTPAATAPAAPAAPAAAAPGAPAAPAAPPARGPRARATSRDETAGAGGPPREAGSAAGAKGGAAAATKTGARKGPDRLELDTTDITGNRELPKVLYIVPWKRSDLGDLAGRPVNSLLDEVLQPLDRDVFQRENRYYDALKPGQTATRKAAGQGSGDKP